MSFQDVFDVVIYLSRCQRALLRIVRSRCPRRPAEIRRGPGRAVPPPQPPDAPRRARGLPGLLSFVTALQYNPRSPLHLSLAIAALTSLIVHRPRPPVEIRRGPGRACAVHHPDTIAQLDTLPLDLIVNFSPLPAATCLATFEAGAAACVDALRRAAGEVPARRR